MGRVAFITSSIDEEYEVMPAIELVLESENDLEAWVLPDDCTPEHLRRHVLESSADVFVVSSNRAEKLASMVAACTNSPVVALPVNGDPNKINLIFKLKGVAKSRPTAIVDKNDTKAAADLAISLAEIPKKSPKKGIFRFLTKRWT